MLADKINGIAIDGSDLEDRVVERINRLWNACIYKIVICAVEEDTKVSSADLVLV